MLPDRQAGIGKKVVRETNPAPKVVRGCGIGTKISARVLRRRNCVQVVTKSEWQDHLQVGPARVGFQFVREIAARLLRIEIAGLGSEFVADLKGKVRSVSAE